MAPKKKPPKAEAFDQSDHSLEGMKKRATNGCLGFIKGLYYTH